MKVNTKKVYILILVATLSLINSLNPIYQREQLSSSVIKYTAEAFPDGNGSVLALKNHKIDCGLDAVLQGFHLIRPDQKNLSYELWCKTTTLINKAHVQQIATAFLSTEVLTGNLSTNFLDRHLVKCPTGFALQAFKLEIYQASFEKIRYIGTCVETKASTCEQARTEATVGGSSSIFLESQTILLKENQVLTEFKLNTRYTSFSDKMMYYSY